MQRICTLNETNILSHTPIETKILTENILRGEKITFFGVVSWDDELKRRASTSDFDFIGVRTKIFHYHLVLIELEKMILQNSNLWKKKNPLKSSSQKNSPFADPKWVFI